MEIIQLIFNIAGLIIFVYFGFFALYFLFFSVASLFYRERYMPNDLPRSKYAIFIPAYKEDQVIVQVAHQAIDHQSQNCSFDVYIIADSLKKETIEKLESLPLVVIEVSFEQSTKSKALNRAMKIVNKIYDYAIVLDADNVMEPGFIDRINDTLNEGFIVVQGHRKDKNKNTSFAILDAVSEAVNNSIFRKGHRVTGLSAALIGSGFAIKYEYFKKLMKDIHAVGGFDKELEIKIIRDNVRIGFSDKAVVLDEKVQKPEVFARQRRRWLSAQFIYFSRYFFTACRELLIHRNIDFFDKIIQMVSPPRVLQLGLTGLIAIITWLTGFFTVAAPLAFPGYILWLIVFTISIMAIILSTPRNFYTWKTMLALLHLPKAFFLMLLALFRLKGANKKFIHTQHGDHL